MDISVVVPAFNSRKFLPGLIDALRNQDFRGSYEIIIVDDGSTDGTEALFQKPVRNVLYIRQENKGPAFARNAGLAKSRGKIVAFTDSDCIPGKGWLSQLRKSFAEGASAVEGRTTTEGKVYPDSHFIKTEHGGMFVTSNIAFLRSAIRGFDERYPYPNREDSDIAFSLISKGEKIAFAEKAVVRHRLLKSSLKSMLKRKLFFESDVLLFKKYPKLYKEHIRFPVDRFAPVYFIIAVVGLFSIPVWLGLPIMALLEIAYRNYAFGAVSLLKFLVAQTLGSFLNLFAVLRGCIRYRVNPFRLL